MSYSNFYQKHGFPWLQKLLGRPTMDLFESLRKSECRSGPAIRREQLAGLSRLYSLARKSIPLYSRLYENGPSSIDSYEQFASLPILERQEVSRCPADMVTGAHHNSNVILSRTGGSSGEPLSFYTFNGSAPLGLAMMMRARIWWNVDFNERNALFIEHGLKFESDLRSRINRTLHKFREHALNRRFFSAYNMSDKDMAGYYQELLSFKPAYLIGYASFLYLFAKYCNDQNLSVDLLSVRCIFYTSEMLYPWQREMIESVFKCPVVGEYGCKEVGVIAYQCPQHNWHTMDESVYVEVLPLEDEPGIGEILVTQLKNDESPFIRYRTGDLALLADMDSPCSCGRGLHIMGSIQGRSHDWIIAPSGNVLHGQIFTHALIVHGGIDKFQIHQAKNFSIRIRAVVKAGFSDSDERSIIRNIVDVIGEPIEVTFEQVLEIDSGDSGKFRWIKSDISIFERPSLQ